MAAPALLDTHCPKLQLLARGKVRDIYAIPDHVDVLLFVSTDRISAFDVIMKNGIPRKGQLLNQLSAFWFEKLSAICPNHMITCDLDKMPAVVQEYASQLQGRTMLVKKCEVLKCEAIVRGYLTGSAYAEYTKSSTVHGIRLPANLPESHKLSQPLFTPSTKADVGDKDENIHPDRLPEILSDPSVAPKLVETAVALFSAGSKHAASIGLILADTKFEFGLLHTTSPPTLLLIDEALTPDSSRFWPADEWAEGKRMTGFDKQYLREWLKSEASTFGKDGQAVEIPSEVVAKTWGRYLEAFERITGKSFE